MVTRTSTIDHKLKEPPPLFVIALRPGNFTHQSWIILTPSRCKNPLNAKKVKAIFPFLSLFL